MSRKMLKVNLFSVLCLFALAQSALSQLSVPREQGRLIASVTGNGVTYAIVADDSANGSYYRVNLANGKRERCPIDDIFSDDDYTLAKSGDRWGAFDYLANKFACLYPGKSSEVETAFRGKGIYPVVYRLKKDPSGMLRILDGPGKQRAMNVGGKLTKGYVTGQRLTAAVTSSDDLSVTIIDLKSGKIRKRMKSCELVSVWPDGSLWTFHSSRHGWYYTYIGRNRKVRIYEPYAVYKDKQPEFEQVESVLGEPGEVFFFYSTNGEKGGIERIFWGGIHADVRLVKSAPPGPGGGYGEAYDANGKFLLSENAGRFYKVFAPRSHRKK